MAEGQCMVIRMKPAGPYLFTTSKEGMDYLLEEKEIEIRNTEGEKASFRIIPCDEHGEPVARSPRVATAIPTATLERVRQDRQLQKQQDFDRTM
eukprot:757321-Prymnesium_polylepis.1